MLEAEQEKSQANQNAAVSETWQAKFDMFDQAGGTSPRYINQLEWRERVALTYNAPALFLGILYFLWKGMWRKGLGLLGFCLAVGVVIEGVLILAGFDPLRGLKAIAAGSQMLFCMRANACYYRMKRLGDQSWNPFR